MEDLSNIDNINEKSVNELLVYIREQTKEFASLADENEKVIAQLGDPGKDLGKKLDSRLNEAISFAQAVGVEDLSTDAITISMADRVLESMNDEIEQTAINGQTGELVQMAVHLNEKNSFLNREMQNIIQIWQGEYEDSNDKDSKVELLKGLKKLTDNKENLMSNIKEKTEDDTFPTVKKLQEMYDSLNQLKEIKDQVKEKLNKNGGLPPSLAAAESKLSEAKAKCKKLQDEVQKLQH